MDQVREDAADAARGPGAPPSNGGAQERAWVAARRAGLHLAACRQAGLDVLVLLGHGVWVRGPCSVPRPPLSRATERLLLDRATAAVERCSPSLDPDDLARGVRIRFADGESLTVGEPSLEESAELLADALDSSAGLQLTRARASAGARVVRALLERAKRPVRPAAR